MAHRWLGGPATVVGPNSYEGSGGHRPCRVFFNRALRGNSFGIAPPGRFVLYRRGIFRRPWRALQAIRWPPASDSRARPRASLLLYRRRSFRPTERSLSMRVLLAVVCGAMALAIYATSRSSQPEASRSRRPEPSSPRLSRVGRPPLPLPTHFNRLASYYRVHLN